MKMFAEHIASNIGNTVNLVSIPKNRPMNTPISLVYTLKTDIGNKADHFAGTYIYTERPQQYRPSTSTSIYT